MADQDSYVQVQPNSTGAKVDVTLLDNGNVRQTATIGDPNWNQSVASVVNGALASGDVFDQVSQNKDTPDYNVIMGDPDGDFAGVALLEQLMDDASGLGLGVRVLNQPKLGPDGGLLISDGKRIDVSGSATAVTIIDTLGYQSIDITTQSISGSVTWSNDLITFQAVNQTVININTGAYGSSLGPNTNFVTAVVARYMRIAQSAAGTATLYLRTVPFTTTALPAVSQSINIAQVNGAGPATPGVSGGLAIGGLATTGSSGATATSGNPVKIGAVDTTAVFRGTLADQTGALTVAGTRLPLVPDTKTTNPLPAYVPPPPLQAINPFEADANGGELDTLRLIAQLMASIDRRLQELPGRLVAGLAAPAQTAPVTSAAYLDTDDFNASDALVLLN